MTVDRVHWVGGFARAQWLPARRVVIGDNRTLAVMAAAAPGVCGYMNRDRAEEIDLCVHRLRGRKGTGWRMTGADPDGCDLRHGPHTARLPFDRPALSVADWQERMASLTTTTRFR